MEAMMIISELSTSIECVVALFTLLYMGKLILESPFLSSINHSEKNDGRFHTGAGKISDFSVLGGAHVVKRSLLNQHIVRRA